MQERRVESRSIGGVLSEFYLNVKLSVQLLMITWKTSKESIIMVLILNGWKIFQMLVPIFQMFINLTKIFLNKETNTVENFYFLILQFVMFRDYTDKKFKSVSLMKINICTQVMQKRRVEGQSFGGVRSELYLNVKLSVQLLTITWKTSQESIIMVLILNV